MYRIYYQITDFDSYDGGYTDLEVEFLEAETKEELMNEMVEFEVSFAKSQVTKMYDAFLKSSVKDVKNIKKNIQEGRLNYRFNYSSMNYITPIIFLDDAAECSWPPDALTFYTILGRVFSEKLTEWEENHERWQIKKQIDDAEKKIEKEKQKLRELKVKYPDV